MIKSSDSGLVLGKIIEKLIIDGQIEYVVEHKNTRFFVKYNKKTHIVSF